MSGITKEAFIKEFTEKLKFERASLFIGSGLSRQAGYATWKDTLRSCAEEMGLDVDKEEDLITLAEFYLNSNQRTKINQLITSYFKDKYAPVSIHRILSTLPVRSIWTTNYDTLIERYLGASDISYSVVTNDRSYTALDPTAKVKVHKIHGDVNDPEHCVIARRDYEQIEKTHEIVLSELKGEMCTNSFLFLGYSFSDVDIQHILSRIRLIYDHNNPQRHFCIMKGISREDCVSDDDYNYKLKKQGHYINDMQSYGLHVLLIDSFDEIEKILEEVSIRVHIKDVLINGAYEESNPIAKIRISPVAQKLAQKLIESDYRIVTGYGKNLGADIVTGAFRGCDSMQRQPKHFNEYVTLFPFAHKDVDGIQQEKIYTAIRENMVSKARISIFICGQKVGANGRLVNSAGVVKEYELARAAGHLIIPISSTGGSAMQIWEMENQSNSFSSKYDEFKCLNNESNPDKIVGLVMSMITKYTNDYK